MADYIAIRNYRYDLGNYSVIGDSSQTQGFRVNPKFHCFCVFPKTSYISGKVLTDVTIRKLALKNGNAGKIDLVYVNCFLLACAFMRFYSLSLSFFCSKRNIHFAGNPNNKTEHKYFFTNFNNLSPGSWPGRCHRVRSSPGRSANCPGRRRWPR